MKKRKLKAGAALAPAELASNFTRGLVATGLLAAVQDRWSQNKASNRKVARLALQGGTALAAGIATAESLRRGDSARALLALAVGAAGVVALEKLMNPDTPIAAEEVDVG